MTPNVSIYYIHEIERRRACDCVRRIMESGTDSRRGCCSILSPSHHSFCTLSRIRTFAPYSSVEALNIANHGSCVGCTLMTAHTWDTPKPTLENIVHCTSHKQEAPSKADRNRCFTPPPPAPIPHPVPTTHRQEGPCSHEENPNRSISSHSSKRLSMSRHQTGCNPHHRLEVTKPCQPLPSPNHSLNMHASPEVTQSHHPQRNQDPDSSLRLRP